ncbi:hypothetical protein niasHT_006490 [Heterodera trifolii]|uniref:Lon proteolytic domain-containing protein n=1 Tax=Heterodera trifolii TaxID=157864 RepID=A0ABD2LUW6_9BILA
MRLSLDTIREFVKLFISFCQEPLIPLSSYREFLKAAFESDEAQLNSSIEELRMPRTRFKGAMEEPHIKLPNEFIGRIGGDNFFRRTSIEVMAPPKNEKIYGPSASVAIFTAFMALATGFKVRERTTLTGEVWSNMTVGAIGGLRQKVIAATKANKRTIVLSVENAKQYKKLDKKLRDNLTAHYVDDCYELVAVLLVRFELINHRLIG